MNLTLVKERKYTLTAMKEQKLLSMKAMLADIKLIDGAIGECDYWVSVIDRQDTLNRLKGLQSAVEKPDNPS